MNNKITSIKSCPECGCKNIFIFESFGQNEECYKQCDKCKKELIAFLTYDIDVDVND